MVERGGKFVVVILPREKEHAARSLLPDGVDIIDLYELTNNHDDKESLFFKNDGHWNEYGNMLAALEIYRALKKKYSFSVSTNQNEKRLLAKYYAAFDDGSRPPVVVEGGDYKTNELRRIHSKYLALELNGPGNN